jgi:hypothetical protein
MVVQVTVKTTSCFFLLVFLLLLLLFKNPFLLAFNIIYEHQKWLGRGGRFCGIGSEGKTNFDG